VKLKLERAEILMLGYFKCQNRESVDPNQRLARAANLKVGNHVLGQRAPKGDSRLGFAIVHHMWIQLTEHGKRKNGHMRANTARIWSFHIMALMCSCISTKGSGLLVAGQPQ
jgi:hypothetical protein